MSEKPEDRSYAPLDKDTVCQHQTLYPGKGIELGGGMAIGFQMIPLNERYGSFVTRLAAAIRSRSLS